MKKKTIKNNWRRKRNKNLIIYNDSDTLPKPKVPLPAEICFKDDDEEGDRISELPDDILLSILSLLTFREATATKILSSRWGRLGPFGNVISLDFPFRLERKEWKHGGYIQSAHSDEISDYISRVNHALDSYEGGLSIDRSKIDVPRVSGGHCEKWLEFALTKETDHWAFLHLTKHDQNSLPGFKYLKELSLSGVNIGHYEDLFPKLVALECLTIESPQTIFRDIVEVSWCVNVKYLNIYFAKVDLEICYMPKLVSLRCHELESYYLDVNDTPKLVDISIVKAQSGIDCRIIPDQFDIYGNIMGIRFYFRLLDRESGNRVSYMPPILTKVKHMVLDIDIDDECSKDQVFPLIKTCPNMLKLEIKFLWSSKVTSKYRRPDNDLFHKRKYRIHQFHTLMLSGYRGTVSQFEFVLYVVNNSPQLVDLVIVEPEENYVVRPRFITRAFKHLRSVIPTSVNFILSREE